MTRFRSFFVVLASFVVLGLPALGATAGTTSVAAAACGPAWSVVASPNDGTGSANGLRGVSARSDSNVLAVGKGSLALAEHWNGTAWNLASAAHPGIASELNDVHFVSNTDGWAVGETFDGSTSHTLIERWNGSSFSQVASPEAGAPLTPWPTWAGPLRTCGRWDKGSSAATPTSR